MASEDVEKRREVARRSAKKCAAKRNAYRKKWVAENKEYVKAQAKKYYENNREKARVASLKWSLKQFGLTAQEHEVMVKRQGGECAICKKKPPAHRRLDIDHCHATGRVRGLLCRQCNHALGFMCDDVDRFASAITYLLSH